MGAVTRETLLACDYRCLVAGSRGYSNYADFCDFMDMAMKSFKLDPALVCFITGKARSGADHLIIEWCEDNEYNYYEEPAKWDEFGKAAGMIRNNVMGKLANYGVILWDGSSRGTRNMLEILGMSFSPTKRTKWRYPVFRIMINQFEE